MYGRAKILLRISPVLNLTLIENEAKSEVERFASYDGAVTFFEVVVVLEDGTFGSSFSQADSVTESIANNAIISFEYFIWF